MNDTSSIAHFVEAIGASIDTACHCDVSGTALEPADNLIAPLTHYGFLETRGTDSAKFLQGQTTCNLNEVSPQQSLIGAYCTAKGRMVSSFRIAATHSAASDEQTYLLRMRRDLVESTRQAFAKYIVFSKAGQSDASDCYLALGLRGAAAATAIASVFDATPAGPGQQLINNGNLAIQLDDEGLLFEAWIRTEELAMVWPRLSQGLSVQGSRTWELLCIRRGYGEVSAATAGEFIPQMLNYETIGAVNFKKGCYTGQEVVARMQYKGTMKRRMYRVRIDHSGVSANDPLFRPNSEQSIGEVVNAVDLGDGSSEALAVITIKDVESGMVQAGSERHPVEVLSLPYAINK